METVKISIKEMKRRGFTAIKANYLLCVFAALVLALTVEGSTTFFSGGSGISSAQLSEMADVPEGSTEVPETFTYQDENGEDVTISLEEMQKYYQWMQYANQAVMFIGGHLEGCFGVLLHLLVLNRAGALGMIFAFFVSTVIEVGCCRFYIVNSKKKAYINEIASFFKKGKYRRTMMIQLYRMSYIFSWGLLLIVPGVVKAYEYRLVPYLLADGVEKKLDETLQMSRDLMNGHKKEAFLMDLSFLGWDILGVLTFGIVSTFFANPYKHASRAEFYAEIRRNGDPTYSGTSYSARSKDGAGDPFAAYHAYQKKNK